MTQSTSQTAPVYNATAVAILTGIPVIEDATPPAALPGYITFFDPGWSILTLRDRLRRKELFSRQTWYDNEPVAQLVERPCYRQLRMEAVPNSFGKTFSEQRDVLPLVEGIPFARVVVTGMVIHFLATGERLFSNYYVRCADQTSGGNRVYVGLFDRDGLDVDDDWDDGRDSDLGLASSPKF